MRFNPRARDGREYPNLLDNITSKVSIHAPVMDAKSGYSIFQFIIYVSIHAPVMDAKGICRMSTIITSFNPRARDGREI